MLTILSWSNEDAVATSLQASSKVLQQPEQSQPKEALSSAHDTEVLRNWPHERPLAFGQGCAQATVMVSDTPGVPGRLAGHRPAESGVTGCGRCNSHQQVRIALIVCVGRAFGRDDTSEDPRRARRSVLVLGACLCRVRRSLHACGVRPSQKDTKEL